mgnify:CR=1
MRVQLLSTRVIISNHDTPRSFDDGPSRTLFVKHLGRVHSGLKSSTDYP